MTKLGSEVRKHRILRIDKTTKRLYEGKETSANIIKVPDICTAVKYNLKCHNHPQNDAESIPESRYKADEGNGSFGTE